MHRRGAGGRQLAEEAPGDDDGERAPEADAREAGMSAWRNLATWLSPPHLLCAGKVVGYYCAIVLVAT